MNFKYISEYGNKYKIYESGKIFMGDEEMKTFIHKMFNVPFVSLCLNKHSKSYSIARLVYETFVGKIKDKTKLKYIDGDSNNVCLSNLTIIKRQKEVVIDNINAVEWKYVANCNNKYKVYKNGHVYEGENKLKPYFDGRNDALSVKLISANGGEMKYTIARLVYETFVGQIRADFVLNYKDNNKKNYHLGNLEIVRRRKRINDGIPIELDKTKEWKPIRGYEELYKISEHGDVYSVITNKMMIPQFKDYHTVYLTKDKESHTKLVHTLVYATFNDTDLDDKKDIDHIDRNKINNHKSNLREVTRSENNKNKDKVKAKPYSKISQYDRDGNFIKKWDSFEDIVKSNPTYKRSVKECCLGKHKHAYGFVWKYDDFIIDQTGYEQIKTDDGKTYSNYKINKEGIVISKNGHITKPNIREYAAIIIVGDCGHRGSFLVHRLVMITFVPNPENKSDVNHLDRNKHNNNIDNLQWATSSENVRHAISKQIQQIDIKTGKVIKTHECITEALKELKINNTSHGGIGQVCMGKQKTAYGFKWKYIEQV